jgi:hypothetical protein
VICIPYFGNLYTRAFALKEALGFFGKVGNLKEIPDWGDCDEASAKNARSAEDGLLSKFWDD